MNYWKECITEAFEDAKITATQEQINTVASWVESGHNYYGMYTGDDVISANHKSPDTLELERLKQAQEKQRIWECDTVPCRSCTTTGNVIDNWGRNQTCYTCDGKGRHR